MVEGDYSINLNVNMKMKDASVSPFKRDSVKMTEIEEEISIEKVKDIENALGSIEEPEQTDVLLVSKFGQQA